MKIIGAVFAVFVGSNAWAQSTNSDRCHTYVASDAMRLACYDKQTGFTTTATTEQTVDDAKIMPLATPSLTPPPPSNKGNWQVSNSVSEIDDTTNVYLSLTSESDIAGRFSGPGPMILNIHCRENKTLLYIYFNGLHMSDYQYGTVTYRLDSKKAQKKKMHESTDHSALGLWNGGDAIPFVKAMFGNEKLLLQATPLGENAVTANFQINGLEEAIRPLRESCNW